MKIGKMCRRIIDKLCKKDYSYGLFMTIQSILKEFGLSEKEIAVYTALISLGPSPVRMVALKSKVNRGTTYDILKSLMEEGLVSYFNKATKQYFIAEPPEKLLSALKARQQKLEDLGKEVAQNLPELKAAYEREGGKPQVRLYEGDQGIRQILADVLESVSNTKDKLYYVYSSASVRENVQHAMPDFNKRRLAKKIKVNTLSLGPGGELHGLDERKWLPLSKNLQTSTYEIIYAGKVAHISLDDAANPVGVVIENAGIYETQKIVFEFNWEKL